MAEPNFNYENAISSYNVANIVKMQSLSDYPWARDFDIHHIVNILGTSQDTKPIPCGTGSTFYEIDTGDLYVLVAYKNESDEFEQLWTITPIPENSNSDDSNSDDSNS